jgi:hypothetical protein
MGGAEGRPLCSGTAAGPGPRRFAGRAGPCAGPGPAAAAMPGDSISIKHTSMQRARADSRAHPSRCKRAACRPTLRSGRPRGRVCSSCVQATGGSPARAHAGGGLAAAAQLECGGGGGGGAPPVRPARSAPPTFHARPAPARSARPSRTERRSARRDLATQRLRFGLCGTLCALRAMQRRRTPDGASRGPTGSPNGIWSRMTDYFVNAATGFRPPRKSVCTKVLPTVRSALGPAVSRLRLGFRSRCWCCAKVGLVGSSSVAGHRVQ